MTAVSPLMHGKRAVTDRAYSYATF